MIKEEKNIYGKNKFGILEKMTRDEIIYELKFMLYGIKDEDMFIVYELIKEVMNKYSDKK